MVNRAQSGTYSYTKAFSLHFSLFLFSMCLYVGMSRCGESMCWSVFFSLQTEKLRRWKLFLTSAKHKLFFSRLHTVLIPTVNGSVASSVSPHAGPGFGLSFEGRAARLSPFGLLTVSSPRCPLFARLFPTTFFSPRLCSLAVLCASLVYFCCGWKSICAVSEMPLYGFKYLDLMKWSKIIDINSSWRQ